jgi:Fe-S cluster assembly protein SufD
VKTELLTIDALRHAVSRMPDDRLMPIRLAALEHLANHGLPTLRDEDWKYTDLRQIVDISNRWLGEGAGRPPDLRLPAAVPELRSRIDADWIVIVNGRIDGDSLAALDSPGVQVTRLSDSDLALDYTFPLTDLNAALMHDGLRIRLHRDAAPRRPIGLLVCDMTDGTDGVSQVRLEIELAAGAHAALVEYHVSTGSGRHYSNCVVNLALAPAAFVDYVRIQDRDRSHAQTARLNARIGLDSRFNHCAFDLGGGLVRNDLDISIDAAGASASFDGLYLVGNAQHIDNHTRVDHRVGPAISRQHYRGILNGEAHGVWNGKAIVHSGADGTDAAQSNHNLLLSDKAEIDTKPELEIYADDVKCSHGTTVGQLDEAALYYLRTRGLERGEAQQLLMRAFAQSIVAKAPVAAVREMLTDMVAQRLASLLDRAET